MSYEDLMRLAMFDGNDDAALVRFRHAVKHARAADAEIAALRAELERKDAAIRNMLDVMARRGRLDDGDWSQPIRQMRDAIGAAPNISVRQDGIDAAKRIIEIIDGEEDLNQPALFRPTIRAHAIVVLDALGVKL